MKIRILSISALALLLSIAGSGARSHHAATDDGGPLSRDRGLAEGESAAVAEVLRGVTGTQADAPQTPPSRQYSPDYYRAYPQRSQTVGPAKKVAVAPEPATPALKAAPAITLRKVAPTPTAAPMPKKRAPVPAGAPASKIVPLRVAVMPAGIDRSGAPLVKVAAKPTPTPAPKMTPLRVALPPRATPPPATPAARSRQVATQPAGPEPVRVLFRD